MWFNGEDEALNAVFTYHASCLHFEGVFLVKKPNVLNFSEKDFSLLYQPNVHY
jgi:hypothetical protein